MPVLWMRKNSDLQKLWIHKHFKKSIKHFSEDLVPQPYDR
jgi:hypothetical protein